MKSLSTLILSILLLALTMGAGFAYENDEQILYHTFNGNYAEATALVNGAIAKNPDSPKYHYLKANLNFYSRYFGGTGLSTEDLMTAVASSAETAIAKAEVLEESPENNFYIGSSYGLLSRAHFMKDRSVFDAYSAAKDAKSYLEDVIEEDPNFHDAYVGLAVIEYFAATRLQGWWQETVAWVTGMSGDKERAMEYYKITARDGKLCKAEANFLLSVTYQFLEPDPALARQYMANFLEKYPDNSMIGNNYRRMQLEDLIVENGVTYLEDNIDSLRSQYSISNDNVLNNIGYAFINREDFDSAVRILKLNAELYPMVANCYDSLGECYMLMGNNAEAIRYYNIAAQKVDGDTTRSEQGKQFLRDNIEQQLQRLNAS